MSVSLLEVIESGGYDLSTVKDANWLLSVKDEMEELVEKAEATIEKFNLEAELESLREELEEDDLTPDMREMTEKQLKTTQEYYDKYFKEEE